MTTPRQIWSIDRPIAETSQDRLERGPFVERFVDALIDPRTRRSTGVVVGVTGPWGSGKSSVLNLIQTRIQQVYPGALLVRFDPWLVSGRDELVALFMDEFLKALEPRARSAPEWRDAATALADYADAVSPLAKDMSGPLGNLLALVAWLARRGSSQKDQGINALRETVATRLRQTRTPIVVLIDELDRVEDAEVRAVAQLVRAVVDFPGISYVLAYDYERVVEALGMVPGVTRQEARNRGGHYLEKIVQFSIPLPIAEAGVLRQLLYAELQQLKNNEIPTSLGEGDLQIDEMASILVAGPIETPRDVKRTVGQFRVLEGMTRGEVNPNDLLGYASLCVKCPAIIERIRRAPERFVDDPLDENEQIARAARTRPSNEATDYPELTEQIAPLFRALFPAAFGDSRTRQTHPLAISRRRTLLTVLRLGLSHSDLPRTEIEGLFLLEPSEIAQRLREAEGEGRLGEYFDRIDDLYSLISEDRHLPFWQGVSLYLEHSIHLTPQEILNRRELISTATRIIIGRNRARMIALAPPKAILMGLIIVDDVNLVPDVLRIHFFMYGLFGLRSDGGAAAVLESNEVEELAHNLARRWSAQLLEGTLFNRLSGMAAIYAMMDTQKWSTSHREYMTEMLENDRNVDHLALLMFGGNHLVEDSYVDRIVARETFVLRARQRLENLSQNPNLQTIDASRAILRGALERAVHGLRGTE